MMKRSSQENSQEGLQQKYYGGGQIRNMKDRGKKDGRKTGDNRKIPQDEIT